MADLMFLALAIGFFALAAAYIRGCAAVAKIDEGVLSAAGGVADSNTVGDTNGHEADAASTPAPAQAAR